jgi:hypothetical protein
VRVFEAGLLESVGVRDDLLTAGGASDASCVAARFGGILALDDDGMLLSAAKLAG